MERKKILGRCLVAEIGCVMLSGLLLFAGCGGQQGDVGEGIYAPVFDEKLAQYPDYRSPMEYD